MPQLPDDNISSESVPVPPVTVEFPAAFWQTVQAIAHQAGVTPEAVISAGTSLYSLAIQAKAANQKMAIIERDQDCITEIKGL